MLLFFYFFFFFSFLTNAHDVMHLREMLKAFSKSGLVEGYHGSPQFAFTSETGALVLSIMGAYYFRGKVERVGCFPMVSSWLARNSATTGD